MALHSTTIVSPTIEFVNDFAIITSFEPIKDQIELFWFFIELV